MTSSRGGGRPAATGRLLHVLGPLPRGASGAPSSASVAVVGREVDGDDVGRHPQGEPQRLVGQLVPPLGRHHHHRRLVVAQVQRAAACGPSGPTRR